MSICAVHLCLLFVLTLQKTFHYLVHNLDKHLRCAVGPNEVYSFVDDKKLYLKYLTSCMQKDKMYMQLMTSKK